MKTDIKPLAERAAWKSLTEHSHRIKKLHLRELFAQGAKRGDCFAAEACGLFLDYWVIPELESPSEPKLTDDSSTNNLIRRYRALKTKL